MFKKLRSLIYQLAKIDYFDDNYTPLSNITPLSNEEKHTAKLFRKYPQLKPANTIQKSENEWIKVIK